MKMGSLIALIMGVTPAVAWSAPPPIITPVAPRFTPESYQNWRVTRVADMYLASTSNDSGSAFGVVCNAKGCSYYVNPRRVCETDDSIPAVINSTAGAVPITFSCVILAEKSDDPIYLLMSKSTPGSDMFGAGQVSVALPINGIEFAVTRFSMLGARAAIARIVRLSGVSPSSANSGLRDTTM